MERHVQVSERTKTAEELAELERQRLEALEARRQKRMRAGADEADDLDAEGDVAPSGGYKARRQKRQKRLERADHGPSGWQHSWTHRTLEAAQHIYLRMLVQLEWYMRQYQGQGELLCS